MTMGYFQVKAALWVESKRVPNAIE